MKPARFQKDGPKRRRRTRRETPEGGYSQYVRDWHPRLDLERVRERARLQADRANFA